MDAWIGFIAAALALAGSPGPANLSLAAVGAAFGARRGVAYLAGIVAGMGFVIGVTASSVTGVVRALPGAAPVLLTLAAAYFAYLAVRIATAPPLGEADPQRRPPSFLAGLLLSLVNPKGYAAMGALFSGFAPTGASLGPVLAIELGSLAVVIVGCMSTWLLVGAALTRVFHRPASSRLLNVTFAVLLLASMVVAWIV